MSTAESIDFGPVRLSIEGVVGIATLNEPARRNPMGPQMISGLHAALRHAARLSGLRCLMLTGEGSAFCSGGDIATSEKNRSARDAGSADAGADYSLEAHQHPLMRALRDFPFPVLTAVNGPAVGIGVGYALLGDLVTAAQSAFFASGFTRLGLTPDGGSSWLLPRLVGSARAREMLLLGDRISAAQALDWGMVNRVFPEEVFRVESLALAKRLGEGPTVALNAMRDLMWRAWGVGYEEQIDAERRLQQATAETADAREGARAFVEKRAPRFEGR